MPIIVDKQKKRNEIIEAAIAVFSRTGYRRAKMKDVADEAGVGKGTVYEYFRSKQDLFLEMSEYLYEQYILKQKKELESVAHPEQQIRTLIASTLEQAAMWTGLTYLFVDVWSEMDRKGEEDKLRRLMSNLYNHMAKTLAEYIRQGQAAGVFKEFDANLMALIILGTLDGLVFQLLINKNMFDLKAMSDTLTEALFAGLRK